MKKNLFSLSRMLCVCARNLSGPEYPPPLAQILSVYS